MRNAVKDRPVAGREGRSSSPRLSPYFIEDIAMTAAEFRRMRVGGPTMIVAQR